MSKGVKTTAIIVVSAMCAATAMPTMADDEITRESVEPVDTVFDDVQLEQLAQDKATGIEVHFSDAKGNISSSADASCTFSYEGDKLVKRVSTGVGKDVAPYVYYKYDKDGNVIEIDYRLTESSDPCESYEYEYTGDELTKEYHSYFDPEESPEIEAWIHSYDGDGNRKETKRYETDSKEKVGEEKYLISTTTYTYDKDGNETREEETFTEDGSVAVTAYAYDKDGNQISAIAEDDFKETDTYDKDGDPLTENWYEYNEDTKDFQLAKVYEYTYDSKGRYSSALLRTSKDGKTLTTVGRFDVTYPKENGSAFADVSADKYYADAVVWAVKNNITKGTSATTFSPNAPCTRGQIVTFLYKNAGSPDVSNVTVPFKDVKPGAYYENAVKWAVSSKITSGVTATSFAPNATCTRGQIVTFLYKAVPHFDNAPVSTNFADVSMTAYYATPVGWALLKNITGGTTKTTFSPNAPCTRAQAVTFLYKANQ
ncbi:MAG: S-layer homology domain-containing protein [Lachnospiraceae bacterium]|nr:S-layer homology domain-containing protein [Lachnospiraceae bacterium]